MNTAIANSLTHEEAAVLIKTNIERAMEDEDLQKDLADAYEVIRRKERLLYPLKSGTEALASALDDASTNVKDQARRIIELHAQLAGANERADRADQLADDLAAMLGKARHEITRLRTMASAKTA